MNDLQNLSKDRDISGMPTTVEKEPTQLHSKEETIVSLENGISKNEDLQDGDVSSVGNISRTEEVSRFRDVEDSFEERYLKLRCIAVKMKKNIAELNQQLKVEKTERATIQSKFNAAVEQAKRNQALQEECDRIADELEMKTKEIKELRTTAAQMEKQNNEMKHHILENDSLRTEKQILEECVRNMTSKLQSTAEEKFAQETLKKEREKEIEQLKQKVNENEEYIAKILNDLEQAKLEARKQGALTLEMRDYEKTISDLTKKLEKQRNIIEEQSEKLKINAESNTSLLEQIKQLEDQVVSYGVTNRIADEQILHLNKTITSHEKNIESKDIAIKQLTQQLEDEKCKNEKLTVQLTNCITELNSLRELSKTKEEFSNTQLKCLQNKITSLEEKISKKENEFDKLKEDYESYKIRAHNVLQKLKSQNISKDNEEKLKTELNNWSETVNELRKRLDDALTCLEKRTTALKIAETVKEKLQTRIKELNESYAEKNKELDNLRVEYKSFRLNNETLVKCYKDEMNNFKTISENLKTELENLKILKERENVSIITSGDSDIGVLPEEKKQENVEIDATIAKLVNKKHSSNHEKKQVQGLIPLDVLLQADSLCGTKEMTEGGLVELKNTIKMLENQIIYLNGILNESEKNAARNEQQVALLKDEIRRLQRTIERAPHLQNGEYLKNFFTFPDGEEKCRLITILETLLQLTSEETETLSAIAKGCRVEQKRSAGQGLSSMLRLW